MMTDRELIDAAIAEGKLRVVPMGMTINHDDWAKFAIPKDTRSSAVLCAVLLALQDGRSKNTSDIASSIRLRRYPAGALPFLTHAELQRLLTLLEARRMVRRTVNANRRVDRWQITKKAPKIDSDWLRRRLVARAAAFPIQPRTHQGLRGALD